MNNGRMGDMALTHIAKAAAVQLRAKGIEVVRCEEVGMADATDEEHLRYATDNGYIMVSQDADFPSLNSEWQCSAPQFLDS
jgi:predicted nuclease of predicted toxin-antitoxin system